MRLSNIASLFSIEKLKKLRYDFKTPYKALLATSGLLRRPLRLKTKEDIYITVNRGDLPIWDEYFNNKYCKISITGSLFYIQPVNKNHQPYYVCGSSNALTYSPQRWNTKAHQCPLVQELEHQEYSIYSQHGEDGILQALFNRLPIDHKYIVEFGAHDGINMSNSRYWINNNDWSAFLIESDNRFYKNLSNIYKNNDKVKLLKTFVTPENIDELFHTAEVPVDFEILSIDIDSIDYYVWQGLNKFRPKVVVVESNPSIPPGENYIVPREKAIDYSGTSKEGASISSLYQLGIEKGYQLIYSELSGTNLFFVDKSLLSNINFTPLTPEELYQPPQYGRLAGTTAVNGRGYN